MGHTDETAKLSCWLDVDLDAIAANVGALQSWVGGDTVLAAVLKAQGYGTGAVAVAEAVVAAGARRIAVARVHEGVELRKAGVTVPILVMNRTEPEEAEDAVRCRLAVTVDTIDLGRALSQAARRAGARAMVHVKVDTGLHRFGVDPEAALPLARALSEIDGLEVEGLYTHFASADEPDRSFTLAQIACFEQVTRNLADAGYRFAMRHAANSAGTLGYREAHFDMVRIGLTLYGVTPSGSIPHRLSLRPALALRARIARVSELAEGEGAGYGQTWHASRPTRVALVTAGYADGLRRALSNRGEALVCGARAPIIGRVSMDQTTLDITDIPGVRVGDVATFFGTDGEATLGLAAFAGPDTIPHEALTSIGARVARVYRRGGRVQNVARLDGTCEVAAPELAGHVD